MVIYRSQIHSTAKIGEGTKIGAFCDIGKHVVIGENCNIQTHVTISNGCRIGNNVFIGPNTSLLNDKHLNGNITPVILGDDVKVAGGVLILPGVHIGNGVEIKVAGAIVTKDISPNTIIDDPKQIRNRLVI